MPRFGEEKQADLLDVRAGGDVDEVVLVIGPKLERSGEAMERRKHLLEVPGIGDADFMACDDRLRGNRADVPGHDGGEVALRRQVDEFEPIDDEVLVLAQADRRPPPRPTLLRLPGVEPEAEDSDDDGGAVRRHRHKDKQRVQKIETLVASSGSRRGVCGVSRCDPLACG